MSAKMVTKGSRVADVGCDHAHTGIWLIKNDIASKVIAMDVRKGPLEKARENIKLYGLDGIIETRLSDGLEKLSVGEADSIVIAGMGGTLTVEILKNGIDKAAAARELILQPQSDIGMVRRFLGENGFVITQEKMCKEDGKFYNSMRAVNVVNIGRVTTEHFFNTMKSQEYSGRITVTDQELPENTEPETNHKNPEFLQAIYDEFGEILLKSQNPVLKELLLILQRKNERNLKSIEASENEAAMLRKSELEKEKNIIEEALGYY
ncbi:MAG: SAM-dependent methyltransferase [Lachnospiraceae bacterium]|nr:SAM-dependent methyltransferase [Lachnospiraceae bacterium]